MNFERTTAEQIMKGLDGNLHTGMCLCPAHEDNNPSLSVREGDRGVVFKCHAGCSQEAVMDALREKGLWAAESRHRPSQTVWRQQQREEAKETTEKAWQIAFAAARSEAKPKDYLKGRGINIVPQAAMLLPRAETKRLIGKSCPAMVLPIINDDLLQGVHITFLSADGTEKLNTDSPRRMYGAVKCGYTQLGLIDPDRCLIIGEGIETVLAAMQLAGLPGVAALSAPNLRAINPPPCAEYIIAADNDETGRKAAEAAAGRLAIPGRRVRMAIAPEGDWNDALQGNRSLTELKRALLNAPLFEAREVIDAVGMEEFVRMQFPRRANLLKPWLTAGSLAMIYADPGVGKTRLALSIAYAVASGTPLLGWECEHRARVLYVDGELPGDLLQRWLGELGESQNDYFKVLSHSMLEAAGRPMLDLGEDTGRRYLNEVIERHRPELVILDSISTLVRSGMENEAEAWRPMQEWSLTHRAVGRTVIYLHHAGRSGKARGTSMREVPLDASLHLKPLGDESTDTETAIDLRFHKARHFFGADVKPQIVRFGTASGTIEWRGEPVVTPNAERVAELVEEGCNQSYIASKLKLTKGRVSQIVKGLEKKRRV